jgi:hypothetical protein
MKKNEKKNHLKSLLEDEPDEYIINKWTLNVFLQIFCLHA